MDMPPVTPDKTVGEFGLAVGIVVFLMFMVPLFAAASVKWVVAPLVARHVKFLDGLEERWVAHDKVLAEISLNMELMRRVLERDMNGELPSQLPPRSS